jgi:hypothetical protein
MSPSKVAEAIVRDAEYTKATKKLLMADELPEGPYRRYLRDIFSLVKQSGYKGSFEDYCEEDRKKGEAWLKDHPLLLEKYLTISPPNQYPIKKLTIRKHKDHEWYCSLDISVSPYDGHCDTITLEQAISYIDDPNVLEEIRSVQ